MRLLLVFVLLVATQAYSQSSLEELKEKRQELHEEILVLQDSLRIVDKKIAKIPIQNISEPISAYAMQGAILRKKPNKKGQEIEVLKKKTNIQVIDTFRSFYLVCISGNCGYIHKKDVRRNISPPEEFSDSPLLNILPEKKVKHKQYK